ncbi:MAG: hypothetical protein KAS67_07075 [Thermoplasmata archaeon]|nr:hypothetical protein [Thermoplasmata archaeon]
MSEDGIIIFRKGSGQNPVKMAIVGCGGMGCNTLRSIRVPDGVKTIAIGGNRQEIAGTRADVELVISQDDAMASAKSKPSRYASNDAEMELSYILKEYDMVFPVAGLGGNTGGWMVSLVGRAAKLAKTTPIALVTTPLNAEGREKRHRSTEQLEALRNWTSAIIFKNDQILKEVPNLPLEKAFRVMNKVVVAPIDELSGLDKGNFKDMRGMFRKSHIFRMDAAEWRGDNPTFAINEEFRRSDWLSLQVLEPKCAIFFIKGFGVNEGLAAEFAEDFAKSAKQEIPMLACLDDSKATKEIKVTAIIGL